MGFVLALALLALAPAAHALTQAQAQRRALSALKTRAGSSPVVVFRLPAALPRGTVVRELGTARPLPARRRQASNERQRVRNAAGVALGRLPVVAHVTGEPAFLFYEDRGPYQTYEHPGRIALVGARSGKVRISRTLRWAPLVDRSLPAFLATDAAYRDARYRAFAREWTLPAARRAVTRPRTKGLFLPDPGALARAHEALVAEGSCFVRISDTVGVVYDRGSVETAEVALSELFKHVGLTNPFEAYRYSIFSGTTPTGYIQRRAIGTDGCRDVFVYIAGAGFRGRSVINVGNRALPGGATEQQNLSAAELRRLILRNPSVTFKVKVDAPYSAPFVAALTGLPNLLITEAAATADNPSFGYMPPVAGAPDPQNGGRLSFTHRQVAGLESFLASPREVDHARAAIALGQGRSFMAWMLARAYALGEPYDLPSRLGFEPVIQTFGFTATPPPGSAANRAPDASAQSVQAREDETKAITLTGSDPDGDLLSYTVETAPAHGTLSGSGPNLTYTPAVDYAGPDSFTFRASDGRGGESAPATVSIDVAAVNDPARVTTSGGSAVYTEQESAAVVDGALTVADPDDVTLEGAQVRVSDGFEPSDRLEFADRPGITGSYDDEVGVLTLSGSASVADYRSALRDVRFRHTGDGPAPSRTVEFRADDGDGLGPAATRSVAVSGVDDPPSVDTTDSALSYAEDDGPLEVDPGLVLTDPDSATFSGAKVQITSNFSGPEDELSFDDTGAISSSYDDTTGTLTLSGNASESEYQAALRAVRYENSSDNPSTATRTVSFQAHAAGGANPASNVATRDVTVDRVNDAPVASNAGTFSYTENESAKQITSTLALSDVDDANLEFGRVAITANQEAGDDLSWTDNDPLDGITLGSDNDTTDVLALTGTGTVAQYQAALRAVRYSSTDDNPATGKTIAFVAGDGDAESAPAEVPVTVTRVNDASTLDPTDSALAYEEGDGAVAVDGGITVSDPDSTQLVGAKVQITSNFSPPEDALAFDDTATITHSYDDTTGTLTLTGTDTLANYEAALRAVKYENSADNPSTATRTVSFQVDDGGAVDNLSNVATRDVTVGPANDAPTVTTSVGATSFTEGGGATAVDSALTATDPDDTNLESAEVRISQNFETGDVLAFSNTANITHTYDPSTGVLTLSGTDTVANYQAALRSVTYDHTGNSPQTGKVVELVANDGAEDSNAATKSINITGVNDGPTVATTAGSLAYTEGDGDVAVDPGVTVDDPENNTISGATVQITSNHAQAEDGLAFTDTATITHSYDDTTGTLTLSGTASESAYQTALRSVRYVNGSDNPSTSTRTVSFRVTDTGTPSEQSNVATRDVTVARSTDAPTVTTSAGATSYTEGGSAAAVDDALTVADPDDTNLEGATVRISSGFQSGDSLSFADTANVTGDYDGSTGILTLSGTDTVANYQAALRSIEFSSTNQTPVTSKTVEFKVNDGDADSNAATKEIAVTPVNSPPSVTSGGTLSYTEDDPATAVHGDLTVSEPEGESLGGASASITSGYAAGQDELAWTDTNPNDNITKDTINSSSQTIVLTGVAPAAAYQAALREVTYRNTSQSPLGGNRTVTFSATDVLNATGSDTRTIAVTSVDDPPTAADDSATVLEDAAATSIPVLTNDSDVDGGQKTLASATDPANGTVVLTGGSPNAHTGLTYQPDPNYCNDPPGTAPDTFNYTLNGGSTAQVSMTVTCVNDAPVADDETFNGNDSAHGNTTMQVDDPDDDKSAPTHPHTEITGDILAGDTDVDGPQSGLTVTPETRATNDGGTVHIEEDGDFTYHPAAATSCTDTSDFFDYTVEDNHATEERTDTGRVTIAIAGCVWYVHNSSPGNSGTSQAPFDTLAQAEAASGANHTVFVYDGDNTTTGHDAGGYQMNGGERLIGEHEGLTVDPDQGGPLTADTLHPANAGAHPTITANGADVVDLDDGNEIRGFVVDPGGAGGGIFGGSGDTGGGTIDDVIVVDNGTAASQPALELDSTTGTFNVSNFVVNNKATGVRLNDAGAVDFAGDASQISITSDGGPGLLASGTNMSTSQFDDITVTNSSNGGVDLNGTTGTTVLGDGTGTDLSLSTSGAAAAVGLLSAGDVTIDAAGTDSAVNTNGGPALNASGASGLTAVFETLSSSASSTDGIRLDNIAGTVSAAAGTVQNAAEQDVDISGNGSGDTVSFTYDGNVSDTSGTVVSIANQNGGTKDFNGAVSNSGGGVTLTSNTGTTMRFDGGLTLTSGSAAGLNATGGGTLAVTGATNTLASTTGTALSVQNTTIHDDDLTFRSVAANGAANGILLNNTSNANGRLVVAGNGGSCTSAASCTGGTIQNATAGGISLTSVPGGAALTRMAVTSGTDDGIRAVTVGTSNTASGLALDNVFVSANGNAAGERGLDGDNVRGHSSIASSTFTGSAEENARIDNDNGVLDLKITGSTFSSNSSALGSDGLQLYGDGTALMKSSITGSTFSANRDDGFQMTTSGANTATMHTAFNNNTVVASGNAGQVSANAGVTVSPGSASTSHFQMNGGTIKGSDGSALILNPLSTAQFHATIDGITIGAAGEPQSGSKTGIGLWAKPVQNSDARIAIRNSVLQQYAQNGMYLRHNDGTDGTAEYTVTSNTIITPNPGLRGIYLESGATPTDTQFVCADIGGAGALANSLSTAGGQGLEDIYVTKYQNSTFRFPGLTNNTDAGIASYLANRNAGNGLPTAFYETAGGAAPVTGNSTPCAQPTLPTAPAP